MFRTRLGELNLIIAVRVVVYGQRKPDSIDVAAILSRPLAEIGAATVDRDVAILPGVHPQCT